MMTDELYVSPQTTVVKKRRLEAPFMMLRGASSRSAENLSKFVYTKSCLQRHKIFMRTIIVLTEPSLERFSDENPDGKTSVCRLP
jgi:hypothetical protein